MTALGDEIATAIEREGPLRLDRYMTLCLQHPRYGYYMTHDPFGALGDFITAPEISQMFGEMIGLWLADAWSLCGAPQQARLVELGPGRGTLMTDVLRALRVAPGLSERLAVDLVETSPALRQVQRETLAGETIPIEWRDTLAEAPRGPLFLIANEFFDALPVRQFVRTAPGWRERVVGLNRERRLAFGLAPGVEPDLPLNAPLHAMIEISPVGQNVMAEIAQRIASDGGAALIIDYGYTKTTLGESLQAVSRHAYVDPLTTPGEADLTAHVDFAALARAARAEGAKVLGPTTQGRFLTQIGIERRAAALRGRANDRQKADIDSALHRLTGSGDPREVMGDLFKVMAVTHPDMPDPPGFAEIES
ncbi:class I SAM-dependent methyltransferase [Methylocystis bryophila]|uniref:class I SAM-dependent methyltransferase n=2 Tax=Methylocystis bryophila TaxID=655015 RepID=UPI0024930CF1|nr:SAM-dependent methyltransferase [Methylocystis bryophila]BDV38321.1 ATP synthase subunit beta [Methylocystis bryophila]